MLNAIVDYQIWRSDPAASELPPETARLVFGFRTTWIALTGAAFLVLQGESLLRHPWDASHLHLALPLLFAWLLAGPIGVKTAVRRKRLGLVLFTTDLTAWEIVSGDWAWLSWIVP